MKRISLFFTLALALSAAQAVATETTNNTQAPAYFAGLIESADAVSITYRSNRVKTQATFSDKDWNQRLAAALQAATYAPRPHCFCISYPEIEVKKDGRTILTLSVHHDTKVRAYAKDISGDFEVGSEIGAKISALADEKKSLAQPSKPTAPKP